MIFDWLVETLQTREELKCVCMENGEPCVMMDGTQLVHMLHVNLWVYQEVRLTECMGILLF